ncbi:hypothetical protein HYN59_15320 [Flavobacterium album]|uniref:AMP-activated protein kinase glycogen-binding domain-containing protein n=1 Tax=Flavobacterium album TaxID=2175091 RepID=A0A2S1R180_9FLAO|nr:hypothetical protein [Flavobacterium album]AWH86394.1 hypothetical protein HYN59_15320 [Flavobacterium album]
MRYVYLLLAGWLLVSCVQPTTTRNITFTLSAKGIPPGSTASVRGGDKPLSWQQDTPMQLDSIAGQYRLTVTMATGYRFTEYKYVVNGQFEFPEGANRKAVFGADKEVVLNDTFNTR